MLYLFLSKSSIALFGYITFRAIMSSFTVILLSFIFYPKFIKYLKRVGAGEAAKEDAPAAHMLKAGTPTMGGVVIIFSIFITTLLWADLTNKYIITSLLFMVLFAFIGLVDDLIKLKYKQKRETYLAKEEKEWLSIHENTENSKILTADNNNKRMETFLNLVFEFIGKKVERDDTEANEIKEERREIYKKIKDDIYKLYFIREIKTQVMEIKKIWQEKKLTFQKWDKFITNLDMNKSNFKDFQNELIYFIDTTYPRKYEEDTKLDTLVTRWYNWVSIPYARQELIRQKSNWIKKFKQDSLKKSSFMVKTDGLGGKFRLLLEFGISAILLFALFKLQNIPMDLQMPFVKNTVFNIGYFYLAFGMFVIAGFGNAVNLTDGLDGLASGTMMIAMGTLTLLIYLSGHAGIANYLHILYIKDIGELSVFGATVTAASIGFLWYNAKPASIFMGDVGSLGLGASFGAILVMSKNELLGLVIGGIFVAETLSVMIQVSFYKKFKRRIFRMTPIHHHFEKMGIKEGKIVIRFWLVGFVFALISIISLKIR